MRTSTVVFLSVLATACTGEPAGEGLPSTPVEVPPAVVNDAFHRVNGEDLPPQLDSVYLDCDVDSWRVVGEMIGRAANVRATIVDTAAPERSFSLPLQGPAEPLPPQAVFQRFEALLEDPQRRCTREGISVVVEASDASGRVVDCVAWGVGVTDVVAGEFERELPPLPHGEWATCRVR